jgi:protein-tyrosine phosphatase
MVDSHADKWALSNRPVITSETHPIPVDFLPQGVVRLTGRIGMTFAPGKCNFGRQVIWQRNLQKDLARLRQHYGTDVLVTLLEAEDFAQLQIPDLLSEAQAQGMETRWFPIPDYGTPSSMQELIELVQFILVRAEQGQTIVIHCKAGLGRTGLVSAACLVALGCSVDGAFALVRKIRPGSVETPGQEAYVAEFAQKL